MEPRSDKPDSQTGTVRATRSNSGRGLPKKADSRPTMGRSIQQGAHNAQHRHHPQNEIVRLARKELKKELEGLKKASATYRSEIAALKRRILALEKQAAHISKKVTRPKAETDATTRVRFSAKGFSTKRKNLGLSAADMGKLLGVSSQTVYHWESGKTKPRQSQLEAVAEVRKMGKRQANAALSKDS